MRPTFLVLSIHNLQLELIRESDLLLFHDAVLEVCQGNVEAIKRDLLVVQAALELEVNARHRSKPVPRDERFSEIMAPSEYLFFKTQLSILCCYKSIVSIL